MRGGNIVSQAFNREMERTFDAIENGTADITIPFGGNTTTRMTESNKYFYISKENLDKINDKRWFGEDLFKTYYTLGEKGVLEKYPDVIFHEAKARSLIKYPLKEFHLIGTLKTHPPKQLNSSLKMFNEMKKDIKKSFPELSNAEIIAKTKSLIDKEKLENGEPIAEKKQPVKKAKKEKIVPIILPQDTITKINGRGLLDEAESVTSELATVELAANELSSKNIQINEQELEQLVKEILQKYLKK